MDNIQIPNNLSECFDALELELRNSPEKEWFRNSTEDEVINSTHYALGEWVRNTWNLWDKDSKLYQHFNKMGLWHPDDISTFIIRTYHRFINKKELDLPRLINVYIEYWKNYKKNHGPIN